MQKPLRVRSPKHLDWVRDLPCAVCGQNQQPNDPAHVRRGTDGGTGLKPSDCWVIPLCHPHHFEQHTVGELTFSRRHRLDMKAMAECVWGASPHKS
jgi:hypothetical protein